MNTLLHADIFFFITAIAIVVITIVLCITGCYIILILRDARYVSQKLRHAVDELGEDFEILRDQVSQEGHKAKHLVKFFLNRLLGKRKKNIT